MRMHNIKKGKNLVKGKVKCATAGFVLSIFRSASANATPTPRGEKEFGVEFNYTHWALKSKNILNLCSLPQTSALCVAQNQVDLRQ